MLGSTVSDFHIFTAIFEKLIFQQNIAILLEETITNTLKLNVSQNGVVISVKKNQNLFMLGSTVSDFHDGSRPLCTVIGYVGYSFALPAEQLTLTCHCASTCGHVVSRPLYAVSRLRN